MAEMLRELIEAGLRWRYTPLRMAQPQGIGQVAARRMTQRLNPAAS